MIGGNGDAFADKNRIRYIQNLTTEVLEHKFSINPCTNGLALTEKMWNSFGDVKKHRDKLDIAISLDAATKDTYNINRVLGDWDLINENLKFLSTLNLGQLNIDMTVQKNNYKEMVDFVKFGRKFDGYCGTGTCGRESPTLSRGPENTRNERFRVRTFRKHIVCQVYDV